MPSPARFKASLSSEHDILQNAMQEYCKAPLGTKVRVIVISEFGQIYPYYGSIEKISS